MPSVIQKKYYNSAKVFWLNKELLESRINLAVKNLISEHPEVSKVVLFGSVADNRSTPFSDVDILIVTDNSQERFLDRSLSFMNYFEGVGLGIDIFVYTSQEAVKGIPLVKLALKQGKVLFEKIGV